MSDAEALQWLDRLLSAEERERAASLGSLSETNPRLHARLVRMLAGALSNEDSQLLARPVIDGFVQITDATRSLAAGDVLSGYRLIRELGRGGMSVVWLAERADGVVKRKVALKMPMFMLLGTADVDRFARERDALAALSHRNVARLYDAGVLESGQPFIVLEHVDGQAVTAHCDAARLDLRARIKLFLQVLSAVEHAHKHLIVHRDLKPSNILVDAEGQVKLLDFGIAKLLGENEAASALTQAGGALTPLYAGPEQIRGGTVSTLTDVFSLGVVLCELLSGALPYRGARERATQVEIVEQLAKGELPRASQSVRDDAAALARGLGSAAKLREALTGDLDIIIGKALRVSPEDRYASAAHLADDLRRYLDHLPVAARAPSLWYTLRLALRRHQLAASVAGLGLVLVIGASIVAWMQYLEARINAQRTAAVRDFMFDLVNDAEATEGHEGEVTGRQMLDGAVLRARRDFRSQPQLQGELLSELGRMYTRVAAPEAAVPVLEEAIRVLEGQVPADDPALNKSRVFLAGSLMQTSDDGARITALAKAARVGCSEESVDCLKARAYASNILSQMAAFSGDSTLALAEMRRSADEGERAFGPHHEETAMAHMILATIARNAGELIEADRAMQRALAAAQGLKLRNTDRVLMERTMAVIDFDLGRYSAARDRLLPLIARITDAAERAVQLRILANVQVELRDAPAALKAANEAVALNAAPDSADLPYARQAHARALALAGARDAALTEIDAVIGSFLEAGSAADSFEVLRAQRYRAEFLLALGRHGEALQALRELRIRHETAAASPVEQGQMLDSLGEAEQLAGQSAAARNAHEAARKALASQLTEAHPLIVRNTALLQSVGKQPGERE